MFEGCGGGGRMSGWVDILELGDVIREAVVGLLIRGGPMWPD